MEKAHVDVLRENIVHGHLTVIEENGCTEFGSEPGPSATIHVHEQDFLGHALSRGSLYLGESYEHGGVYDIADDRIEEFIGILFMNGLHRNTRRSLWEVLARHPLAAFGAIRRKLEALLASKDDAARNNIARHYDIEDLCTCPVQAIEYFKHLLGSSMSYTCGHIPQGRNAHDCSLEEMQECKHDLICQKLELQKGDAIADLGCGFGSLLAHATLHYDARGTGVTLSTAQDVFAKNMTRSDPMLRGKIQILQMDYRDIDGTFDKVASVGLAEHACENGSYRTLLRQISSLLKPGGRALLHAIGSTEPPETPTDPWILKYIFPGGRIPRLHEIVSAAEGVGLTVGHVENWKMHYAETLNRWAENLTRSRESIQKINPKFDERFYRRQLYYLRCCEAAFRYSNLQLNQIILYKLQEDGTVSIPLHQVFEARPASREIISA